jgi:alpha-galactosidase
VHVSRHDGTVRIETPSLRLVLELDTLSLDVESSDRETRIRGIHPAVDAGDGLIFGVKLVSDGYQEEPTRSGHATRIEVRARGDRSLELTLELELADDWPGLLTRLSVTNRGGRPVSIHRLLPFRLDLERRGEITLPFPQEALRFFRMGYQSWSPAGLLPLSVRDSRPRLGFVRHMHQGPFTPPPRRGLHVSDFVTTLRGPTSPAFTVGFTSHRRHLTHVTLEHRARRVRSLETTVATEGHPLGPDDFLQSEQLWIGIDGSEADGLAEWAARTGREMDAPVPAHVGTGWCSWYEFFTHVTAADVERNVEALAGLAPLETVQIDDGYEATVGDWLEWDAGFPEGLAPVAAKIRSAGFRAGIWLAPFLVSRASRVAREHPDWLLRSSGGQPVVANVNPGWKGILCYAVDPTHPEVKGWLAEVVATFRRAGFDYLKLDFLYAGALPGSRHDPTQPLAAAYREALATIRSAAQPDPFVLGCGAPIGPSVGLFEAMRIGPDVAPKWRSRVEDAIAGLPAAPSARNAVRNVVARAPLHQRLWINDPDCVLLRDRSTRLSEAEVRTVAAAALVSGGLILLSDDLENLGPPRRNLLARLLPALGHTPDRGPLQEKEIDSLVQSSADGSRLLLVVNLGEREQTRSVALSSIGLTGPTHVYDVWEDAYRGVHRESFVLDSLPAHGCGLMRFTPVDGRPRVVGSTLHLSGGSAEVSSIRAEELGQARLRLALPGHRHGRVLVDPGTGTPVAAHVEVPGELELTVSEVQIQGTPADPGEEQEVDG